MDSGQSAMRALGACGVATAVPLTNNPDTKNTVVVYCWNWEGKFLIKTAQN